MYYTHEKHQSVLFYKLQENKSMTSNFEIRCDRECCYFKIYITPKFKKNYDWYVRQVLFYITSKDCIIVY